MAALDMQTNTPAPATYVQVRCFTVSLCEVCATHAFHTMSYRHRSAILWPARVAQTLHRDTAKHPPQTLVARMLSQAYCKMPDPSEFRLEGPGDVSESPGHSWMDREYLNLARGHTDSPGPSESVPVPPNSLMNIHITLETSPGHFELISEGPGV